jgi:histidine phosphotransferase ChpT
MDDVTIDLKVAELLASRLCHDLVSPVGAVNNGLELMTEDDLDDAMVQEALSLAERSAKQASATVQFFRLAYGQAGRQVDMGPGELKRLAEGYLQAHKAELAWDADALVLNGPDGGGKLILNLIALAVEALQRGGTIRAEASADGRSLYVAAEGPNARLREETRSAMTDGVGANDLGPRAVQGYFSRLIVRRIGGELVVQERDGGVGFQVVLSAE